MLIGPVGCGKSVFLNSLLGEIHYSEGHIGINGNLAYSSEDPWIISTTIRENILMGNLY